MGQAGEALQATVWSCGPTRNPRYPIPPALPHRRSHGLAPPTRGPASRSLDPARDSAMALARSSSPDTDLTPGIIPFHLSGSEGFREVVRPRRLGPEPDIMRSVSNGVAPLYRSGYHTRLAGGFRFDGTSFRAPVALQTSQQP